MPVITEDTIRDLAAFRAGGAPVTSCYLDVDGRRLRSHSDVEKALDVLLRQVRHQANGTASVNRDLAKIESFVKDGFDRSRTRGLAFFSCSEQDLWEVIELPVNVRNRVIINNVPAVGQLESVVQEYDRLGVLLVDKQRARMFVFELGELVDHSELFDALPRDYDTRGERERGDVDHHVDALAQQHLRHAADAAFSVFQQQSFEHLSIGAPEGMANELESLLHPYLRERLCDRITVATNASVDEISKAAMAVVSAQERRAESEAVEKLRDAVGAGTRGVAGLDAVLAALGERRVEQLVVSEGFSASGWSCEPCGLLTTMGRHCKLCGNDMVEIADIVEEAVDHALAQSCKIEVCVDNADLDVMGRIGAFLRF